MNDGAKIVDITTDKLISSVYEILEEKKIKLDDFNQFIFHQGNGNLIRSICKQMGVPVEKAWVNFEKYGNSSSASAGVSLSDAYQNGALKKGDRILLMSMGAGYHLGLVSIVWGLD